MSSNTTDKTEKQDSSFQNRLYPEDQAKVDAFVSQGINAVERKPFRPGRLILILIGVVTVLSLCSQLIARWAGIY